MLSRILALFLYAALANADLTVMEQQQLKWLDGYTRRSYDMDLNVTNKKVHMEILRASTRMRCLELLRNGDRQSYNEFVAAQSADCLSFATYNKLSVYIKRLSDDEYLLLRKAVILTAVSLTPQARAQMPESEIVNNSLDFSAELVRATESDRKLFIMFPPQTNFRHMLYAESGNNMFATLHKMIQLKYMRVEDLNLWFAYWIVNMAGFRGHTEQRGSIYLTEPVVDAMLHLKACIDNMLLSPQYEVLTHYLDYRAKLLGLQDLALDQRTTLAHLGAMMRLYTPQAGRRLYQSFVRLPTVTQTQLINFFNQDVHTKPAITHAPALFANALTITDGNIELVIAKILPIYAQALYISTGSVSLNALSSTRNVRTLLNHYQLSLTVNPDREVAVVP